MPYLKNAVNIIGWMCLTRSRNLCSHCRGIHYISQQPFQLLNSCTSNKGHQKTHQKKLFMLPSRDYMSSEIRWRKGDHRYSDHDNDLEDLLNEESSRGAVEEEYLLPGDGHRVYLIQPDMRRVPGFRVSLTTPQHQLEESATLVESLPRWSVVGQSTERVKSLKSREVFGRGTVATIHQKIHSHSNCTAVYLNIGMLNGAQLSYLQDTWKKPVYDRFTIVLQIFKVRARTKEARLQVALAEIPFYRSRLTGIHRGTLDQQKGGTSYIGGAGETLFELKQRLLKEKEVKLKRALIKLRENRETLRKERVKREFPTVAVVGYTNAGKTSLIKMLTQDQEMAPRDQLFATLDVTAHEGLLPNRLKVLYIDTVGFISDIPTSLIASFSATLEDALYADVILHVRDISHPDTEMQKQTVIQTLENLSTSRNIQDKVIEVCNKVDKVDQEIYSELIPNGAVGVSSTLGYGTEELVRHVEEMTVSTTGRVKKCFKIPMSGPHLAWLYKEATVEKTQSCDEDPEFLLVYAVLTSAAYAKFVSQFGSKERRK